MSPLLETKKTYRHDDHVGDAAHVGDIRKAAVRGSVGTDKPGTVHREPDGQALQRDVVNDLVVASLQEGAVDGAEGDHALASQPSGKGHGVLQSKSLQWEKRRSEATTFLLLLAFMPGMDSL